MSHFTEFSPSMIERIGYYVYLLRDPETGKVFYVGKGYGNRLFRHINDAIHTPNDNDKLDKIREIRAKGLEVKHEILRNGLTEKEASEVEAALIDYIGLTELTTRVSGNESVARGCITANELIALYQAQPVEIKEPAILISVNKLYERNMSAESLYEITHGYLLAGEKRSKAIYAFSIYNGLVRQVYRISRWFSVPARSPEQRIQNRWRFDGEIAGEMQHYIGGSVERYMKTGTRNPVKYVNCELVVE